jgi:hypothetical protein
MSKVMVISFQVVHHTGIQGPLDLARASMTMLGNDVPIVFFSFYLADDEVGNSIPSLVAQELPAHDTVYIDNIYDILDTVLALPLTSGTWRPLHLLPADRLLGSRARHRRRANSVLVRAFSFVAEGCYLSASEVRPQLQYVANSQIGASMH